MKCPKCENKEKVKAGKVGDRQRYKCKNCGCRYTKSIKNGYSKEMKRFALHMYLEGLGLRSIERILGMSNVTIYKWITNIAKEVEEITKDNKPKKVVNMELDEMWAFVQKKREQSGSGWLLIERPGKSSTSMLVIES